MELQTSIIVNSATGVVADDALPLCELARQFEEAGEYEQAREVLEPFWKGPGNRPSISGLTDPVKAELLLRTGTLTGWIGSARQIPGAQEAAKDLISESSSIFERLGITEKAAEASVDLGICYWREGAFDEARITLRHVLDILGESQTEQRLRALLNLAIVEKAATRDSEALRIYSDAATLFDRSSNDALKGKFHNSHANLLRTIGLSENKTEFVDKALVEYAAASFHFEQADHKRNQARVENNVGYLFATIGRFPDAHDHLKRALSLMKTLNDQGGTAMVEDARAQTFLMEGKNADAERTAREAVKVLSGGGEQGVLAEALTTYGKALARLGKINDSKLNLEKATEIAQTAGDPNRGGIAAVTAIEELNKNLSAEQLKNYYRSAEELLSNSQSRALKIRLGDCARIVLSAEAGGAQSRSQVTESAFNFSNEFSLESEVLRYEGNLIRQALEASGGSVTRAARMLGVTHQGLAFILNGRHSDLLSVRTPVKKRRRSIIRYH
jgi:tetratricopeptide (TPR) repeat protein